MKYITYKVIVYDGNSFLTAFFSQMSTGGEEEGGEEEGGGTTAKPGESMPDHITIAALSQMPGGTSLLSRLCRTTVNPIGLGCSQTEKKPWPWLTTVRCLLGQGLIGDVDSLSTKFIWGQERRS